MSRKCGWASGVPPVRGAGTKRSLPGCALGMRTRWQRSARKRGLGQCAGMSPEDAHPRLRPNPAAPRIAPVAKSGAPSDRFAIPPGPMRCQRCGKEVEDDFDFVRDATLGETILVGLECLRPDDGEPVFEPRESGSFADFDRYARKL